MLSTTAETNHTDITTQLCRLAYETTFSNSRIEVVVAATPSDIIDVQIQSCTTPEEENEYITKYLSLVEEELDNNGYKGKYNLGIGGIPGLSSIDKIKYLGIVLKFVVVKWSTQYKMPVIIDGYHSVQKLENKIREQQAKEGSSTD